MAADIVISPGMSAMKSSQVQMADDFLWNVRYNGIVLEE